MNILNRNGDFTELAIDILRTHGREEEEIDGEGRKGVHQAKYVIQCKKGNYFCTDTSEFKPIPKELVGFFIMLFDADINHMGWQEALTEMNWSKCAPTTKTHRDWRLI